MIFNKKVLLKEIMFQYDFTEEHAEKIIEKYKKNGTYRILCELVKKHLNIV